MRSRGFGVSVEATPRSQEYHRDTFPAKRDGPVQPFIIASAFSVASACVLGVIPNRFSGEGPAVPCLTLT